MFAEEIFDKGMLGELGEEPSIEEIAERYTEVIRRIKELEEEKEELRRKILSSEKEKIRTRDVTVKILTKKNAILDNEKIISVLNKQELTEVATISVSKFRKFSAGRFDIDDFIIDYKETKEILVVDDKIDSLQ